MHVLVVTCAHPKLILTLLPPKPPVNPSGQLLVDGGIVVEVVDVADVEDGTSWDFAI